MIVELFDSVAGAPVYVNPAYVVTMRPDPDDPLNMTVLKLEGGETIRARGAHEEVATKLGRRA